MNQLQVIEKNQSVIMQSQVDFDKLARIHGAVSFEREASFALETLKNNEFLANVALTAPDSLKRAIVNVAAIGLSLSPVHKLAYLIPRKGKVCLDISYRGLIQLALDVGAIKFAKAEVVYSGDVFRLMGLGMEPVHERSPFDGKRGEIVGAYCVAKTHDGEFLTEVMNLAELDSVRRRSESYMKWERDNSKTTPWKTDEVEMIKKTVIRRAYKSWPMVNTRQRLDQAVDVTNEADPVEVTGTAKPSLEPAKAELRAKKQRELLDILGRDETKYLAHSSKMCNRPIEKLEDMTEAEANASIAMLSQMVDMQNAKEGQ